MSVLMVLAAVFASAVAQEEVLITDIAQRAGETAWRPMDYETRDGIRGTLLYAAWALPPLSQASLALPVRGRYRIYLGLAGTRVPMSTAPFNILVRLGRDPAPVRIEASAGSDAGWWFQPVEVEWKTADLQNDTLVVQKPYDSRSLLAWVRLVPVDELETPPADGPRLIATNDAYRPADSFAELCAPFMRFAGGPVKGVYHCVGNGPFAFAVPSRFGMLPAFGPDARFENRYAADCARSFEKLHREHPRLVDELADFAHSIGLEYHVSFRTGCALELMEFSSPANRAEPVAAARGICRSENWCRLWDGTPVARPSYAKREVQEFFLSFYREMLTEKVDGINLIWIRALPAMLFEPAFRERFRAAYGEDLAREDDPRVIPLRKEIMTGFLRRVREIAGRKRVSVVVPARGSICESFGLDVARLAKEGVVDEFDVGDSLQTANHGESYDAIEFGYFREALKGTKAVFLPFHWWCDGARVKAGLGKGASGAFLWDVGEKSWCDWRAFRSFFTDGNARPSSSVHPLKTLDGFDAATYPWHVAY